MEKRVMMGFLLLVLISFVSALEGGTELTTEFYISLGVIGIGILIILYLIYSFIRKPKNKWEKENKANVLK
jgi:amino acid permease